ncbi:signal peptidase I [bacterium]|nr:signal peptidase I [bacterium]
MSENPTPVDPAAPPVADGAKARRELVRALVLCAFAVIFVRSFLFELFKIPSSSMVPTLEIGDYIVVSKFNYGLVFPFTSWEFVGWSTPRRGDVIVFLYPKDESLYYIKRVVGLPGDKIEFRGKDLWINGEAVPKEPIEDEAVRAALLRESGDSGELFWENLAGVKHPVKYSSYGSGLSEGAAQSHEVAPDHFFVMGDNRDDSYDSRSWGDVPRSNIRGKAQLVWLSLNRDASWSGDKVRWSRAFSAIH